MPSRRACRHGAHAQVPGGLCRWVPVIPDLGAPRGRSRVLFSTDPPAPRRRSSVLSTGLAGSASLWDSAGPRPPPGSPLAVRSLPSAWKKLSLVQWSQSLWMLCQEGSYHDTQCHLRQVPGKPFLPPQKQQGGQRGQERADEAQSGRSRDVIHDHQGLGFDLAYTFQEAWWMLNTSVVENVCLGQELDPAWQGRILEACALWADVDTIPAGVHTSFAEQKQNLGPAQGPSRLLCRQEARLRPERSVKSILEKDHTTSLTQMEVPLDDHDRTAWPTGKDSMQYGRISNFRKKPQERRFQDGQAPRERDRCRNRVVSTIPNEMWWSHYVAQISLKLLVSSDPSALASQSVEMTGMKHCAQPHVSFSLANLSVFVFSCTLFP
ncbi:uncharacterized protein LOC104653327 isoform X4 [Saimiri boliviensis]|uniref:uncharacterized protein LOC104653327 isoform X4 n=1 Tax=Saimiri boliviensis TaxID=27679 RepID=UPI003D777B60